MAQRTVTEGSTAFSNSYLRVARFVKILIPNNLKRYIDNSVRNRNKERKNSRLYVFRMDGSKIEKKTMRKNGSNELKKPTKLEKGKQFLWHCLAKIFHFLEPIFTRNLKGKIYVGVLNNGHFPFLYTSHDIDIITLILKIDWYTYRGRKGMVIVEHTKTKKRETKLYVKINVYVNETKSNDQTVEPPKRTGKCCGNLPQKTRKRRCQKGAKVCETTTGIFFPENGHEL